MGSSSPTTCQPCRATHAWAPPTPSAGCRHCCNAPKKKLPPTAKPNNPTKTVASKKGQFMLFELRQYRTKPGQREKWAKFMDDVIIPYQSSKGMVVIGSWSGEAEEDLYVWI